MPISSYSPGDHTPKTVPSAEGFQTGRYIPYEATMHKTVMGPWFLFVAQREKSVNGNGLQSFNISVISYAR